MKRILFSGEKNFSPITQQMYNARHVRAPFSDGDILELQDLFLRNGVHYIKVDDVHAGRALIELFLRSLNYYNNVACLSMSHEPLDASVLDLYGELMAGGYLDSGATRELEEFFVERFDHDFMWLEASETVLDSEWMKSIFKQMKNFKLEQLIPILVVSYQDEMEIE